MTQMWRIEIIGEALGDWQDRPSKPVDYYRYDDAKQAMASMLESVDVTTYGPFAGCECEEDTCHYCDVQDEANAFTSADGPFWRSTGEIAFDPIDHRILVKLYPVNV